MILTTILLALGGLIGLVAWIWLLVVAFRVSLGWGLVILLLSWTWIPVIVFAVKYWDLAKKPIILYAVCFGVSVVAYVVAVFVIGMNLGPLADGGDGFGTGRGASVEDDRPVLPPPRPTAMPTHPSWEAIVNDLDREEDDTSWEELVPSPTPTTARPDQLDWAELNSFAGRTVIIEIEHGVPITATLEGAEPDRIRVRHVIGGGEASYWIEREKIKQIRLAN